MQVQGDVSGAGDTRDVDAGLTFIVPQDEKPVFHSAAYTGAEPKVFFEVEKRQVRIADIRNREQPTTIEREGFELLTGLIDQIRRFSPVSVHARPAGSFADGWIQGSPPRIRPSGCTPELPPVKT